MRYNFFDNSFEEIDKDRDKVSISGSDRDLTWAELYSVMQKFKEVFQKLKIPVGHPVIIYGHKESLFPVAILSLINSDIPYIPIDRIYPVERIERIIAITGSQVIINCGNYDIPVQMPVEITSDLKIIHRRDPDYTNRQYGNKKDLLQYIMFTSGSTGEPKGVQITRQAVLSFLKWIDTDYNFGANDVFMNQSLFTFDVSLYDTLASFMYGATVLLIDNEISKDTHRFIEKLSKYSCTVWTSTPSFVYMYLREKEFNSSFLKDIKTFLFAGEELPKKTVEKLMFSFPQAKVFNAYGPTEATVTTTLVHLTADMLNKYSMVPIGFPKRESEIHIDKASSEDDKTGEIIIVGDHVSVGYFNDEELNKKKFFVHNGKRAFRTGDLGYIEDDMVFFIGRNDDQLKVHGYRIELNEITSAISAIDFVEDAACVALKKGNEVKRIIAFVIAKDSSVENHIIKERIIAILEKKLPSYMIPADILKIAQFPINANFKIDKNKLVEIYKES